MKLKFLLFFLMFAGVLHAQEPYHSLVITEARKSDPNNGYLEITNMGDQTINLNDFKFGKIEPWGNQICDVYLDPWDPGDAWFYLPDYMLEPEESYVIANAYDFGPRQYRNKVPGFEGNEQAKITAMYDLADLLIHLAEPKGDETDSVTTSVSPKGGNPASFQDWRGRATWYIEQQLSETDSVVIDQVGGVFDNDCRNQDVEYAVAGVEGAVANSILVRKFGVKSGNLDFANARGVGLDDSEWMPIPNPSGNFRKLYWTVGNHGDYVLDENTLESDVIDIDFAGRTLTVPWGVRRLDGIMELMQEKPGIAWEYHLNANLADSLYRSVRTGDQLTIYVVGTELQKATFDIEVTEPTADANIVVPIAHMDISSVNEGGPVAGNTQSGILGWPRVTKHESGVDTITGSWFGLPNALRTDSLLKYLEKPANASWEFVWVDGVERPDLKNGDKLKVTAQNGDEKEYFLQVQPYQPSHNAYLTAITWPDIPDFYRGIFGWIGDTIPSFNSTSYNYRVQVPLDVDGIPALVAKAASLNAKVDVTRATTLSATAADRTIEFLVTAEDDSVQNLYSVELQKEKNTDDIQPYEGEPFLSEFVFWEQWSNSFGEIANPGNQPLDLSNYMIAMQWNTDPSSVIQSRMGEDEWLDRYDKYVPGYKWVGESQWAITPGILEQDLSVNPIIEPGDVFVFGGIWTDRMLPTWLPDFVWTVPGQLDVQFNNHDGINSYRNPWGEPISDNGSPVRKWMNSNWYMFKILNDSIKRGLKPANDPNDFELIENFGMSDGSNWVIGGQQADMITNFIRKPHIYEGDPDFEGSFGTTPEDAEWTWTNRAYWQARNVGWPMEILNIGNDLGQHFMDEPTHYKSTISSVVYKVSEGYGHEESIWGIQTGTTAAGFLSNIIKKDEEQTLTVKAVEDGAVLAVDELLSMNDTLIVLSADSVNTTKYALEVSEEGLSSDAYLSSALYEVNVDVEPKSATEAVEAGAGTVSGFEYGTQLRTVLNNVDVPAGAILQTVAEDGSYVPLQQLNFDTSYVNVTVNHLTYFEVTAEDGVTQMMYQLQPQASQSAAFVTSDVYNVVQRDLLIQYVPRGTSVDAFMSNILPSLGSTVKLVDKMGLERTAGQIVQDDKLVVTAPDGVTQTVYFLAMLRTEFNPQPDYLAYVLSDVYTVDQQDMILVGNTLTGNTLVSEFHNNIEASFGATAVILDEDGNEKTDGDLNDGDWLKVISADGKIEVMYTLDLDLTTADKLAEGGILLYPNPTAGEVNINGLEEGTRLQVFNQVGAMVNDLKATRSIETISLENQPAGMYLIVLTKDAQLVGQYKVIRK